MARYEKVQVAINLGVINLDEIVREAWGYWGLNPVALSLK